MICPKCGNENSPASEDCARCGVIFARIKSSVSLGPVAEGGLSPLGEAADSAGLATLSTTKSRDFSGGLGSLLLPETAETNGLVVWGRGLFLLGMLIWGGKLIFAGIAGNAAGESLLHLVNLPFHEAGHVLFRPFGQFMTSLGGSLGQLLVPLLCGGTLLLKTRDPFGAAVCGWWFGENFLDLAPYIGDARAGVLPLVGGNFGHSSPYGFHDFEYLLTETGLLRYDTMLAKLAHASGSLLMIVAMVYAGWVLVRQAKGKE